MRADPWPVAAAVLDPEVPVLTIEDLGILREVTPRSDGSVHVAITPTYSGCPATETIRDDVRRALGEAGYEDVVVEFRLSPAWSTDDMSQEGRRKLAEYGIVPPGPASGPGRSQGPVPLALTLRCPQCGSPDTQELSRFGSTACKSLWVCRRCREPFDHFKAL